MLARFLWRAGCARLALTALVAGAALLAATGASAGPGFSQTIPFAYSDTNPCTGEPFAGTGQLHLLVTGNLSNSGSLQSHFEATISGLQATTVTNKKYVVVFQDNLTDTMDSDVMPFHETVDRTVQYIRSGEDGTLFPDDDFYEHFLAHFTVNANGIVTVDDLKHDFYCK